MTDINMTKGVYRLLYSGAVKGRRINAVSLFAEVLFWRLHCIADDFGVFEADPGLVICAAFPLRREVTQEQIEEGLAELEALKLIRRYRVQGEPYGQIVDFIERQPCSRNGRRIQRFPAPIGESGGVLGNPGESGGIQGNPGESKNSKRPDTDADADTDTDTDAETETEPKIPPSAGDSVEKIGLERFPSKLRTEAFAQAWDAWRTHRRELRRPLTPSTSQGLLVDLAGMGEGRAIAAIRHSIRNGWTGIFEEKHPGQKPGQPDKTAGQFVENLQL